MSMVSQDVRRPEAGTEARCWDVDYGHLNQHPLATLNNCTDSPKCFFGLRLHLIGVIFMGVCIVFCIYVDIMLCNYLYVFMHIIL